MTDRSIRKSKTSAENPEQDKLLGDLLEVFDKHTPYKTFDALDVLTVMAATLVTTHSADRYSAECLMGRVVQKMQRIINEELWLEEHTKALKH